MSGILLTIIGTLSVGMGFATAIIGVINRKKIDENTAKTQEVHVLVNSKLSAWIDRSGQLVDALRDANIAVPPAKTKTTPDDPEHAESPVPSSTGLSGPDLFSEAGTP